MTADPKAPVLEQGLTVSLVDPPTVLYNGKTVDAGTQLIMSREQVLQVAYGMFKSGLHHGAAIARKSMVKAKTSRTLVERDDEGRIAALTPELDG